MKKYMFILLLSLSYAKSPVQVLVDRVGMSSAVDDETLSFLNLFSYEIKNAITKSSTFRLFEASKDTTSKFIIQLSVKKNGESFSYCAILLFMKIGEASQYYEGSLLDICKKDNILKHSEKVVSMLRHY